MRVAASLLVLCPSLGGGQEPAAPPAQADFAGVWDTTYGELTLTQEADRVRGDYVQDGPSSLEGSVTGRRLTFRYTEPTSRGEGWLELGEDGRAFVGSWRASDATEWSAWRGARRPPPRPRGPFDGLYETEVGRIRLLQGDGPEVRGVYGYKGRPGRLRGTVVDGRLSFVWTEGSASGEGTFTRDEQGGLTGGWRSAAEDSWTPWLGRLVTPRPGVVWLTVLEAQWEEGLAEQEYSFGAMLRAYFRRFTRVEVRHRRFGGAAELLRSAREVALLAEPALVVVACHGERGQLLAGEEEVPAEALAAVLADAPNVELVHFSSCEVLVDGVAERFQAAAGERRLPVSGYSVAVDWSASALVELLYLDLVAGRRLRPRRAAELVLEELRFAGDDPVEGSPFGAAHFRLVD